MYSKNLVVKNNTGLHARPASQLAELCRSVESNIKIITETREINPKSIINLLAGGLAKGTEFTLQLEGPDENEAGEKIAEFINNLTE